MIRKLSSGKYRLYSRKVNPKALNTPRHGPRPPPGAKCGGSIIASAGLPYSAATALTSIKNSSRTSRSMIRSVFGG